MFARKQILVLATLLAILGVATALPQSPDVKPTVTPSDTNPPATNETPNTKPVGEEEKKEDEPADQPTTVAPTGSKYAEPTGFNQDGSGGATLGQDDPATQRDETWPACDTPDQNPATEVKWKHGRASTYKLSDDQVNFLAPGQGSCTKYSECCALPKLADGIANPSNVSLQLTRISVSASSLDGSRAPSELRQRLFEAAVDGR